MAFPISYEMCFNKLPVQDGFLYFLSNWSSHDINIKILETNKSFHNKWVGIVTKEIMELSAKDLNVGFADFRDECKLALTTNKGKDSFSYHLEEKIFKLQKCKKFKITYLEIELDESNEDFQNIFLDCSTCITEKQYQIISKKDAELSSLRAEIVNILSAFEKCKLEKNDLEISLFSKFALLLNSKKKRIKKLENILQKEGIEVRAKQKVNDVPANNNNNDMEVDIFEKIVDESAFDVETQVMVAEETQLSNILNLPKRQKIVCPSIPSTSRESFNRESGFIQKDLKICNKTVILSPRISPALREDASSEEYFAKM